MVESILVGIFGSAAYETLKRLIKKIFGDIHEDDPIINKTYQAVGRACQRFFDKYKKKFGPPSDSFLSRKENLEILIRCIYLDSKGLNIDDLNPNGFRNAPKATGEALEFLVKVFEEELKTDRELVKEMETIKHHRQMDQVASVVDKLQRQKDQELPQLLTPLPPRKIRLIGRNEDLKNLEQRLRETDRVLLVNGLGGIGKTEVCKRFFYDHYKGFSHAAWVDYVSSIKETFVNAFAGECSDLIRVNPQDSLDDLFHKILQFLNGLDANSLLIIDNIEDPEDEDLDKISALPFKVIANSRLNLQGFDIHSLDFLSDDSCKALFYEHFKGEVDDEHVEKIIHLCNRHTLTVELLARTAQNAAMPVKTLYETLEKKGFNLNELIGEKVGTFWRNEKNRKQFFDHLLTIFDLSRVTESELFVLTNLSVLPPIYIDMNEFSEWIKLKTKDDINSLVIKGWLKQEGFNIFMHQVIQEVIRHRTSPNAETCKNLIVSLKCKLFLKPGENPIEKKEYIIFADSVLQHINEDDKEVANLSTNLSGMYWDLGQLEKALEFQLRDFKILKKILDKNNPDLASSYNNLSMIYQDMGQLEQALEFQSKALKINEAVLDKNHPDLALSYNNLALIYRDLGQPEQALKFQKKAHKIWEKALDKNHPDLAKSYNNLSTIYQDMGQMEQALEFQLKALKINEAVLDKNHPDLAKSYNNLALIYRDLGQLEQALEFQLKALKIGEAVLDKNHPSLATSYSNLSLIYQAKGQLEQALEFQKKALKIREQVLDKNHPDLANSYNNLSNIYYDMSQLEQALEFQLKALKIIEAVLDKNHPSLALSYNNLSVIYQMLGQLEQALEFQEKALKIRQQVLDKNHPDLAQSYNNLAEIYRTMGQLEQALEFQLKALKINEAVLDKNHPDLATSYNNLSLIYRDMGQIEQALEFQLKSLKINKTVMVKNHPHLATSYNNLSMIYRDMGQMEQALKFQKKTLKIREQVLDKKHPDLAQSYNNLSTIYIELGQMEQGLEFQKKALKIRELVLDKNHPDLAQSYHNLSFIYRDMKDYQLALQYSEKAVAIQEHLFPNGHPNLDVMKHNLEEIRKRVKVEG